jgi:hypothetical protein
MGGAIGPVITPLVQVFIYTFLGHVLLSRINSKG